MGSEIRLRPDPVEFYCKKVAGLAATLADPEILPAALETIRGLITRATVFDSPDGITLARCADGDDRAGSNANARRSGGRSGQVTMVAGTGFEPVTFRL